MFSRPEQDNDSARRRKFDDSSNNSKIDAKIDVLGSKLNKLPTQERSEALNDLHGVADQTNETPQMIKAKSQEMSNALLNLLANISPDDSFAYRKAVALDPEYVKGLYLGFLRAESFNSHEAAARVIRFFGVKLELFGEEMLAREIKLKDLGEEETDALRSGVVQMMPHRDRAGHK
jgi:hypothetical protein